MMKQTLRRPVWALAIALPIAVAPVASASHAQPQTPPAYPQYDRSGTGADQYRAQRDEHRDTGDFRRDGNRIDRRLAFLHQRLGITPAQDAVWTGFANEMRNAAEVRESANGREDDVQKMNVVERMEHRARELRMRAEQSEKMARAIRPLYASFNDEQKRIADEVLFRPDNERPGYAKGQRPGFQGRRS